MRRVMLPMPLYSPFKGELKYSGHERKNDRSPEINQHFSKWKFEVL